MIALDELFGIKLHIIAQIIKAEFVVRTVRHVARILLFALVIVHIVLDTADRQAQGICGSCPSIPHRAERDNH